MYKSFVCSCLEYGHLLYFGATRGYLKRLDALQCRAASVCHSNFPSLGVLSICRCNCIGLLLDGNSHGDLQSLLPPFITSVPRRSSRHNNLSDLAQAFRLQNTITFRSLYSYCRSWRGAIPSLWNSLPVNFGAI